jgi:hypothetical protein
LSVKRGYLLDEGERLSNKYALIVCNNYLEHQPLTKEFIRAIRELSEENGIVYISVPNFEYLYQKSCLYEFVADHLVYFTESTLRLAFEANAFEVLRQYTKNNGNDLVLLAKPKKKINLDAASAQVNKIIESIREVIDRAFSAKHKVVIWGAGHRSLALMAIANLDKIECIVDSASFKQNKYSPILHKKIISPDEFLTTECDLLIIMLPGNYSIQVVEYLRNNGKKCNTVVYKDQIL